MGVPVKLANVAREYLFGIAYDIATGVQGLWPLVKRIEKRWPQHAGYTIYRVDLFIDTQQANRAAAVIEAWPHTFEPDQIDHIRYSCALQTIADLERARGKEWVSKFLKPQPQTKTS